MEKELQDLLDNYERSIYGQEIAKIPTIHQIHLLLDYIANQGVQLKKKQEIIDKAVEYIKNKENGKCIHNGIEKGAYTFVLDFDKAREFIWELLEILEDKEMEK